MIALRPMSSIARMSTVKAVCKHMVCFPLLTGMRIFNRKEHHQMETEKVSKNYPENEVYGEIQL